MDVVCWEHVRADLLALMLVGVFAFILAGVFTMVRAFKRMLHPPFVCQRCEDKEQF